MLICEVLKLTMQLRACVRVQSSGALELMASHPAKFALAACLGFGVNSLAYIVIQTASSLTLKVRCYRVDPISSARFTRCRTP